MYRDTLTQPCNATEYQVRKRVSSAITSMEKCSKVTVLHNVWEFMMLSAVFDKHQSSVENTVIEHHTKSLA